MKKSSKIKKNIVLITLTLVMVLMAISPVSAKVNKSGVVKSQTSTANNYSYMKLSEEYTQVAESENLIMSADLSSGLFAIKNKNNGYIWYSTISNANHDGYSKGQEEKNSLSQLIVGYVNKDDEVETANISYLDYSTAEVEVEEIENGIKVNYTYTIDLSSSAATKEGEMETIEKIVKVSVPVSYYLENDHFRAVIDIANVKKDKQILIAEYNLLPYFGAASWTEKGYIFVPDGSGGLINFNGVDNVSEEYNQMVYGDDLSLQTDLKPLDNQKISMPVFGLSNNNDNAIFGIIDGNEASASIKASTCEPGKKGYNSVSSSCNTKLISVTTMFSKSSNLQTIHRLSDENPNLKSYAVNYYFLNGSNANYVGMANVYRDYLVNNKGLNSKATAPTFNVDLYGAIDVKANLMGITYNKSKSLTTYEQAVKIAKHLKKAGISDLSMRYIGWANNGVTNDSIVDSPSFMGILGGKSDFESLTDYAKSNNVSIYPDVDTIGFMSGSNSKAAKTAFGEVYYKYQYLRSVYAYDLYGNMQKILNPELIPEYSNDYIDEYKDIGVNNISLSSLTNFVYSHLKRDELQYRTTTAENEEKAIKYAKDKKLNIAGTDANAYALPYLNKIYKSPIYSSGYNCITSEIPFYQIVLHGKISMTGDAMVQSINPTTTYLKCVESGIELLWSGIYEDSVEVADTRYDDYYGSTYSMWSDDAAQKYSRYQPLLKKIYDKDIVNHTEVAPNVTLTEYSNGIKVYVNFTESDVTVNGIKVPARDYLYKEG